MVSMMDVNNLFQVNIVEGFVRYRDLINDYWVLNEEGAIR